MRPYDNYRQLKADLNSTYVCAPQFGDGRNGDHFGGRKVIQFMIGDKYECEYEEILRERYGVTYSLSIEHKKRSPIYAYLGREIYERGIINEIMEKHKELYECLTEIGKIYCLTADEIITNIGQIIKSEF
jgi:hypothetical protein